MDKPIIVPEREILAHASQVETPFYLYDEVTIRKTCQKFKAAFSWASPGFKNYFAVKATPNSTILKILKDEVSI
jgi:diaminopimelate decarboxylase